MSEEGGTVSTDGVTVEKSIDRERFRTPAIVFEIRSTRDTSARVRLTDRIPEEVPIEDVGFHPEYGGDSWSIQDHAISFERTFAPGEDYETVCGVRDVDEGEIETLLAGSPSLEVGEDEPDDGVAVDDIVGGGDDAVRDVIAGERDSLPGPGASDDPGDVEAPGDAEPVLGEGAPVDPSGADAMADAPEEDVAGTDMEPLEAAEEGMTPEIDEDTPEEGAGPEPSEDGEPPSEPSTADVTDGPEEPTIELSEPEVGEEALADPAATPGGDGIAAALAAELRAGEVDEADERALRDALAAEEEATGSLRARVEHLQSEVSELAAYTGALESFLDEHGGGEGVLDELQSDLSEVAADVADLEDRVAEMDDIEEGLDEVEDAVGDLDAEVTAVGEDIAEAEDEVGTLRDDVEGATDDIEGLRADVDQLETGVDDLLYLEEEMMELRDLAEEVEDLSGAVEGLEADRERIDEVDDRIASVEDSIDDLESDMEEMRTFRDRLSSAFGPGEE